MRDYVNNAVNAAKPQIKDIEDKLGTANTQGPGGGSAMVDVRGLLNGLNGLKTATDAAGNVRGAVAPEIASQIDAEIANINRARQPENPALYAQLQSRISALQGFLGQSGVDYRRPGTRSRAQLQERAGGPGRQPENPVRSPAADEDAAGGADVRRRHADAQ